MYHPPLEKHSWRFLGQADERAERVCRSDRNHVFDRYASARSGQDQARLKAILEKEAAARISPLTHFALWDQLTDFTSRVDR